MKGLSITIFFVLLGQATSASALPQYRRMLEREYGYKAPCATCHSQGGGSSLSVYGKAFDRAGKGQNAIRRIASQVPKGDKLSFDAKLKARANPNDPESTPEKPGDWIKANAIPTEELKEFSPSEVKTFSILEGELGDAQVAKLKESVGDAFQEEDKFPTFYFGEVDGKKKYVVQYVRAPDLDKTIGLVVSTSGEITSLRYVGKKKVELPKKVSDELIRKKLADIEKLRNQGDKERQAIVSAVHRGLTSIQLVFAKK